MTADTDTTANEPELFLPSFCDIRIVFSVVIIGELLAFLLTLASPHSHHNEWGQLSLLSMFIQWIGLSWAALLCTLRQWMTTIPMLAAGTVSYGSLLLCTIAFTEMAYWGIPSLGGEILTINMTHWEFLGRNLGIAAITGFLVLRYFFLRHQLKLGIEAENQARMQSLQARIRPHFLFNSLNAITSLIRHQPRVAEEAIEDLADLFRTNLDTARSTVSFYDELDIARRYLRMETLRLGDRLKIEWELEQMPEDASIPALTLQPLLENAIYHGIELLAQGGTIRCYARRKRNMLYLTIANPIPEQAQQSNRPGNQVAMDNIRQRLLAHFDNEGRVEVKQQNKQHEVTLMFPFQRYKK